MAGTGVWLLGGAVAATALLALFVAAYAPGQALYLAGLAYSGFAVLFVFALIRRGYDRLDSRH